MSYMKLKNLYKDQTVLMLKECYVLEKIHGTSAHIQWKRTSEDDGELSLFSGGECAQKFANLFDKEALEEMFIASGVEQVILYGEAYGGKQQGMSETYGENLKFIVFDVKIGEYWLNVPKAEAFAKSMGFEFVWYTRSTTDINSLDIHRDIFSVQAERNGLGEKKAEGIVIRPLEELTLNNGSRVMAKHKREDFCETKTPRTVTDEDLKVLEQIKDICIEWVTENRLTNILSHIEKELDISDIPVLIQLMTADVLLEGHGELVESKGLKRAIARETALMVKRRLQSTLYKEK